jgi:hypothetical protein
MIRLGVLEMLRVFVRVFVRVRTSERERAGGGEKWRGRRWRLILRQFIWFSEGSEGLCWQLPFLAPAH